MPYKQVNTTSYDFERCKFTHRCARGYEHYDQHSATVYFTNKVFDGGENFPSSLYSDFEDWRVGTHGWYHRGILPIPADGNREGHHRRPYGAHFSPFNFSVIGPSVPTHGPLGRMDEPSRGAERHSEGGGQTDEHVAYDAQQQFINSGLVLNNASQARQIEAQERLLDTLQTDIDWSLEYRETAIMDAKARARLDVQRLMQDRLDHLNERYEFEDEIYQNLSSSQCTEQRCEIHFDTSELKLSGAINDWGVAATTDEGTEVAVFAFDSIELGPEIVVTLTGQRALVLLSRSSVILNTSLNATPGTLGGFQGGFSWGRNVSDDLRDKPDDFHPNRLERDSAMRHEAFETDTVARAGDQYGRRIQREKHGGSQIVPEGVPSNNVNGPGSGNVRVFLQTVTTSAGELGFQHHPTTLTTTTTTTPTNPHNHHHHPPPSDDIDEIQTITTTADGEQTLGGGFKLQYAWPGGTCKTRWGQDTTTMSADPSGCYYTTRLIPHDASPAQVKSAIEQGLNANQVDELWQINRESAVPGVGIVNVTRSGPDSQEGYVWSVTFASASGNVPDLGIVNLLTGMGSEAVVETIREGNSLGGTFSLTFLGNTTRDMPHDIAVSHCEEIERRNQPATDQLRSPHPPTTHQPHPTHHSPTLPPPSHHLTPPCPTSPHPASAGGHEADPRGGLVPRATGSRRAQRSDSRPLH